MTGSLVVIVAGDGTETVVDKNSLLQIVGGLDTQFRRELEPVLKLAEWATSVESPVRTKEPSIGFAPKWENDAISEELLKEIRPVFEQGQRLAFEVPVYVKPEPGSP